MATPKQQKALRLVEKLGDFVVQTIDVPTPDAGEVLVRVESAALNPIDYKVKDLGWLVRDDDYPAILGFDGAGVVVQVGEGVTRLKPGDKILFQGGPGFISSRYGTFQQYALTFADVAFKIPPNISFDEAATLPVGLGTALNGLYGDLTPDSERSGAGLTPFWRDGGRLKYSGKPIVVLSGATSCGQQAIQLARLSGFSPIITTASAHNAELLKSLGATHVIDRNLPSSQIVDEVKNITTIPIQIVFDAVALPETQQTAFDIVAPGGTVSVVLPPLLDKHQLASANKKTCFIGGSIVFPGWKDRAIEFADILPGLLESGEIKPNIPHYIPGGLASIVEGLDLLRKNKVSAKKIVVRPPETV
ncbi:GroES-like protein [Panus rudis PR-1116 ss-1]|nr:GroES-like protein [Panus rudis PR-1116 ss-1]